MSAEKSQLTWRCRRGIREMDIILMDFLDRSYHTLSTTDKNIFGQLLDEADLDILNWIMGNDKPNSQELMRIILLIQQSRNMN